MGQLNKNQQRQEVKLQQVIDDLQETNGKVDRIESAINRMEQNKRENIMALLKQINGRLSQKDFDVQVLNKRVFKVESDVERLIEK